MLLLSINGKNKEILKEKYENHIMEKDITRQEKDKNNLKDNIFVAVYDLQAVLSCHEKKPLNFIIYLNYCFIILQLMT